MSWINNALKNAVEQCPKDEARPAGPSAMHVDCPPRIAGSSNLLLKVLIAVVMLLSITMMWQWFRGGKGELKARARSFDATNSAVSTSATNHATPVSTVPKETKAGVTSANAASAKPATSATSAVATVATPKPITYKLQGILYVPGSSSAVINGKTVMAGERVCDAKVLSIDKDSVVIVTPGGQTNVLDLP